MKKKSKVNGVLRTAPLALTFCFSVIFFEKTVMPPEWLDARLRLGAFDYSEEKWAVA